MGDLRQALLAVAAMLALPLGAMATAGTADAQQEQREQQEPPAIIGVPGTAPDDAAPDDGEADDAISDDAASDDAPAVFTDDPYAPSDEASDDAPDDRSNAAPARPAPGAASGVSSNCSVARLRPAMPDNAGQPDGLRSSVSPAGPRGDEAPGSAPGMAVELTEAEALAAYECLYPEMRAAFSGTGFAATSDWKDWAESFVRQPYPSAAHDGRMVGNYANSVARAEYAKFEDIAVMPAGSVLLKDSFSVTARGELEIGPLFVMEKMGPGFNAATGDWRYILFTPDGTLAGMTGGPDAAAVDACRQCHEAGRDTDFLMLLPKEYRR